MEETTTGYSGVRTTLDSIAEGRMKESLSKGRSRKRTAIKKVINKRMNLKSLPSQSKKITSAISGKMKKDKGSVKMGVDLAGIAKKVAKRKMSGKGMKMDGMGGMGKKAC